VTEAPAATTARDVRGEGIHDLRTGSAYPADCGSVGHWKRCTHVSGAGPCLRVSQQFAQQPSEVIERLLMSL
jgi:hypothetical protein